MKQPKIGDHVMWHDEFGEGLNALVTSVFEGMSGAGQVSGVNLIVVHKDEARQDSYGRQTEHHTSQVHKSAQPAHGGYWRFADEEPTAIPAE